MDAGSRKQLFLDRRWIDGSAGGWLQVEILQPDGRPVPGFGLDPAGVLRGNGVAKAATWGGRGDVSRLAGRPVRRRCVLGGARLYAFQFAAAPEASHGPG